MAIQREATALQDKVATCAFKLKDQVGYKRRMDANVDIEKRDWHKAAL